MIRFFTYRPSNVAYGVYNLDSWNSIHFFMSPEEDTAEIIINGETLATIPFDDIIGGLNLFGLWRRNY